MKPEHFFPAEPNQPPEEWDFRGIHRERPLPFKSPEHASQLIKKISHTFGATLVGITKLNPHWCYQGSLRGVGPGKYEVPKHWEYAIVVVTPHEWDAMYANPTYGTSYDAYCRERMIAGNLETFLHELGYPARAHVPPLFYDMVMPPVAIDAGLGEQGRKGLLITPELGSNARLACVTTNVPMAVDKPIDLGIQDFCRKCKICAERCPGGAISHSDHPEEVRGYNRWLIKSELCSNIWASVATSHVRGCRICLAVCPYTRKNNWMHNLAKTVESRDPTGITASMLLWLQRGLFKYPKAAEFMPPPKGKNATYHEPPDWLQTDKWFDVKKDW
jgi:epoxyqueuosine reductase